MLSLTLTTTNKTHPFLSTPFLPTPHPHHHHQHQPLKPPKPHPISAILLPSSSFKHKQQELYQPYRPPPSPAPADYRNLDTNGRLDILTNRMGRWFEYAPLITTLYNEGFISTTIEEITGIASRQQNILVVATQVRESLIEVTDEETVSFFELPGSPDILYEIRILSTPQRAVAAKFIIENDFDAKRAEELARSMKDFPRREGDRGWECFNGDSPADCLAFMYFRQGHEYKYASAPEARKLSLEKALSFVETERAKKRVLVDLEVEVDEEMDISPDVDELVRVPVVRMERGEVAESSVVVVLPVCRAEKKEVEVEEAPWESGMRGEFGVVDSEKGWRRWVVLPGWSPIKGLKKGGVAVAFEKARGVLPWKNKRRDVEEEILVVADRGRKEVKYEDGFYLIVSGQSLKVERGLKLMEMKVEESLGTVVLIVRPPRDDFDDQLNDEDWE